MPMFIALGEPICKLVFKNEVAGHYLSIATIAMIPMGISQITSSMLNAIGLELKSLKNYVISASLLIFSILFLPKYIGTYSLIVGHFLMSLSSSILNIKMLAKRNLIDFSFIKTMLIMLLTILISSLLGFFIFNLLSKYFIFALFFSSTLTLISVFFLIYIFNIADFKMVIMRNKDILKHKSS